MSSPPPPPLMKTSGAAAAPAEKKKELKKSLVDHTYRDYSRTNVRSIIPDFSGVNEELFPSKLHRILSAPEYARIIAWKRHGRAWYVIDRHRFVSEVLPRHFDHEKFESFNRSVNGWGFKRLCRKGPDQNAYYHEMFLRDLPELTSAMTRLRSPGKRLPDKPNEPDFYDIGARYPLPGAPASPQYLRPPPVLSDVHQPHRRPQQQQDHHHHPRHPPQMPYVPQSPHRQAHLPSPYPPHVTYYQPPPQFYPPQHGPGYPPYPLQHSYPPYSFELHHPPTENPYAGPHHSPSGSSYPPYYSQPHPHSPYHPPPHPWETANPMPPPHEWHPPPPQYQPHSPASGFTPVVHRYDDHEQDETRPFQRYMGHEGAPPTTDGATLERDRDERSTDDDEPPAKRLRVAPDGGAYEEGTSLALPDPVEGHGPRGGEEEELDPPDAYDRFDPALSPGWTRDGPSRPS